MSPFDSTSNLLTHHQFGTDHLLQSYELYIPPPSAPAHSTINEVTNSEQLWLIHLHGGAWRDPSINALNSFVPTLHHLLNPPESQSALPDSVSSRIAGYASLNYRLSPHPLYPQDRRTTSTFELRDAKHPDHIRDVLTGLRHLQREYGFGGRYVLVGHSCGGTLAWQVATGLQVQWPYHDGKVLGHEAKLESNPILQRFQDVERPLAIISICTIYDLPRLVATFHDLPIYREFTTTAFGADEAVWRDISPTYLARDWERKVNGDEEGAGRRRGARTEGVEVAVLAHSRTDGLVDWSQLEAMHTSLRTVQEEQQQQQQLVVPRTDVDTGTYPAGQAAGHGGRHVKTLHSSPITTVTALTTVVELHGRHDEIWQTGTEMARAVRVALEMLGEREESGGSEGKSDR